MNCDEAFDALTDPNGQDNSALKWHLDFCPRCREMQQVLAPALAMFSSETESPDAVSPEAGPSPAHRLPAEFGHPSPGPRSEAANGNRRSSPPFLTPEAVRVAEQTAKSLHPGQNRFAAHWQRFVAIGLLGFLAMWGFFYVTGSTPRTETRQPSDPVMLADQCLWTHRDNKQLTQAAEESSSRWVVLSCVSCHLEKSLE